MEFINLSLEECNQWESGETYSKLIKEKNKWFNKKNKLKNKVKSHLQRQAFK